VNVRMETKKACVQKIGLRAQNLLAVLGSIVNIIWGRGLHDQFNEHKNLYFDYD
jgi:hypothetical protein